MIQSDARFYSLLVKNGAHSFAHPSELYKACAFLANNGQIHPAEKSLSSLDQILLSARRTFRSGQIEISRRLLENLNEAALTPLQRGDRTFLLANHFHRAGAQDQARDHMLKASSHFQRGQESYRELRAQLNHAICVATLEDCVAGPIFILEQEARRAGHLDLVAAAQRTRALELLRKGQLAAVLPTAAASVRSYELEGCAEDQSVSLMILAIGEMLTGQLQTARDLRNQVPDSPGKITPYLRAFDALLAGQWPKVPVGHPLSGIEWNKLRIKPQSNTGKLRARLQEGPATRDELILLLWGETATHPSYHGRLYTAINAARTAGVRIAFDGDSYRL